MRRPPVGRWASQELNPSYGLLAFLLRRMFPFARDAAAVVLASSERVSIGLPSRRSDASVGNVPSGFPRLADAERSM
jgi:hypothetical protein